MNVRTSGSLNIAFRVDASIEIGTGHVMRCLTLADALRERGASCFFVSRAHDGHLLELIAARGHEVVALPAAESGDCGNNPPHAHWLGTDWANDMAQTRQALDGRAPDWLIVDHYALDARWETALRPYCARLMVIDDLADRAHDCDLLLDQSLGRLAADYHALTSPGCVLLTGPAYALLRPEFAGLRQESLERRRPAKLENLLITLGGVDKENVTGKVLDAMRRNSGNLPDDLQISVVMGPRAPWLEQVRALAMQMPCPTQVVAGINDMARRMADADLAIGAAGSTSWERCCLGLPSISLVLADNQRRVAGNLEAIGAVWLLAIDDMLGQRLQEMLRMIVGNPLRLSRATERAASIVDGQGCDRVAFSLLGGRRAG